MSRMRRAALLRLATNAHEMQLAVMQGIIRRTDDGRWLIGRYDLLEWLAAHEGQEIVGILGELDDAREVAVRTCRKCGRDYTDAECPHCRLSRERFRGR